MVTVTRLINLIKVIFKQRRGKPRHLWAYEVRIGCSRIIRMEGVVPSHYLPRILLDRCMDRRSNGSGASCSVGCEKDNASWEWHFWTQELYIIYEREGYEGMFVCYVGGLQVPWCTAWKSNLKNRGNRKWGKRQASGWHLPLSLTWDYISHDALQISFWINQLRSEMNCIPKKGKSVSVVLVENETNKSIVLLAGLQVP